MLKSTTYVIIIKQNKQQCMMVKASEKLSIKATKAIWIKPFTKANEMNQTEGNGKRKVSCLTQGADVLFEGAIFFGGFRASEN